MRELAPKNLQTKDISQLRLLKMSQWQWNLLRSNESRGCGGIVFREIGFYQDPGVKVGVQNRSRLS
jgi:hypothetical protein